MDHEYICIFIYMYILYILHIYSKAFSKAYKYHGVSRFIDDLSAKNDVIAFLIWFKNFCAKEIEVKVERQGNHASFLDFDIKIKGIPHLLSDIPSTIFYGSIFVELLRTARCTRYYTKSIWFVFKNDSTRRK